MGSSSLSNWEEVDFTDLLDISGGTQPPKSKFIYEMKEGYTRLLQIRDFGDNPVPTYIPVKSVFKTCEEEDILIARYGASIGRILTGMCGAYNVAMAKVIIPKEIDRRYIFYLLQSKIFQRPILLIQRTAQNGFNKDDLANIILPVPPKNEQVRIAVKLDALMDKIETSRERMERIKELKGVLTLRFLTNGKGHYYSKIPLEKFIEEGTERIGDKWKGKRKIGISAQEGIIDLSTGQKETFEKYKIVRPGDFIYNTMRVNIGSIGIYEGNEVAITSPDYVVFRVTNELSPYLLLTYLKSPGGKLEINKNTQGSVRSRLYFKYLVNIKFPTGPERVQVQAQSFLKWYRNFEKSRIYIESQLDSLLEALLKKAFEGKLLPQNPKDEPASELLKRIKEEREKQHAQKNGKAVGKMKKKVAVKMVEVSL